MKKTGFILIVIVAILLMGDGFGKWPFKYLTSDKVAKVSLLVDPPGRTIEIQDGFQIQVLMDILNSVVIYREDDTGREAEGQLVEFTLTLNDGSTMKIQPFGKFIFVNDKCYKTEIAPCLELYTLGNRLLNYNNN